MEEGVWGGCLCLSPLSSLGNDQYRGARVVSHQCGLGSNPGVNAIYGVEFVVGFLRVLRLSSFLKNQHFHLFIC